MSSVIGTPMNPHKQERARRKCLEAMIDNFYRKPMQGERGSITSLEIRKELLSKFPEISISNLSSEKIGRALKELKVKKTRSSKGVAYSLVKRAA